MFSSRQSNIQKYDIGPLRGHFAESRRAVMGDNAFLPPYPEQDREAVGRIMTVIDDQNWKNDCSPWKYPISSRASAKAYQGCKSPIRVSTHLAPPREERR